MAVSGYAWVCLSVRDLERSVAWYQRALALDPLLSNADTCAIGAADRFTYLVDRESLCVLGLQQRAAGDGSHFDPERTGLDHLTFSANGALSECQERLRGSGIPFDGPTRWRAGSFIELTDPDDIPIRIFELS